MPIDPETRVVFAKLCLAILQLRGALLHVVSRLERDPADKRFLEEVQALGVTIDEIIAALNMDQSSNDGKDR